MILGILGTFYINMYKFDAHPSIQNLNGVQQFNNVFPVFPIVRDHISLLLHFQQGAY